MDIRALTLAQLARLYDALRSKAERINTPSAIFTLVQVEVEIDSRLVRLS